MVKLKVNGMTCDHCVKRVKLALARVPNVRNVKVDLGTGQATLEGDVDEAAAVRAAKAAGYDAAPMV